MNKVSSDVKNGLNKVTYSFNNLIDDLDSYL